MSRTARWYVVGPEGGRTVILGWSRTFEAADNRARKLDRAQLNRAFAIRANTRVQARRLARQYYGVTVSYLKRNRDTRRWEWTTDE